MHLAQAVSLQYAPRPVRACEQDLKYIGTMHKVMYVGRDELALRAGWEYNAQGECTAMPSTRFVRNVGVESLEVL